MSVQSWQIACPRCGWSNSGAERRCGKCGQSLRTAPGLLVAGESAGNIIAPKAPPKRVIQPGGFFPRLIAVIIDALILAVILVPVFYLWRAQLGQIHLDPNAVNQPNAFSDQLTALGGSALAGSSMQQLTQIGELFLGWEVLVLFYFVGSWTILSGSPGQLVMNLRIVDQQAKGIGFGRGLMRYIFKSVFGFLAPVSVLMVAIGKDKRAIHDLFAGTYVIQYLDPHRVHADEPPATLATAVTAAGAAATETAFPGAAPPRPGQAEARAANAAARAATMAGPAARAALAATPPGPGAPPTDPSKVPTPAPLSVLAEPAPAPAVAAPAPFYAVPAPAPAPAPSGPTESSPAPSAPDESSFERYTPPPMPGPPTSPVSPAAAPPTAEASPPVAAASQPPLGPLPSIEEALALPPLPPPAPEPEPHGDAASASSPAEAAPETDLAQGPTDPYPLPFAPLPPVVDRPEPPAAAAGAGE